MSNSVYLIGQIAVKDYQSYFSQYALKLKDLLPKYQGEVLVGTTKAEVVEGEGFGNWTVIIKFPSRELADACMSSEAYKQLSGIRSQLSEGGNVILLNGK